MQSSIHALNSWTIKQQVKCKVGKREVRHREKKAALSVCPSADDGGSPPAFTSQKKRSDTPWALPGEQRFCGQWQSESK